MKFLLITFSFLFITLSFSQTNTNVSSANFFEGEPYLAIDPSNNQHLVAAWMGFSVGNSIVIKTSISDDGGITWSTPIFFPHETNNTSSADVSISYDNNNNLFVCYIDYDKDNFTSGAIYVRKSTNGGTSWSSAVEAINISDCPNQLCIDRPWMVIDANNSILISSMNADQVSLVSAPYHPYFTVSTDGGNSFNTPSVLDANGYLAGSLIKQPMPSPTISKNGAMLIAYPSYLNSQNFYAQMFLAKSTDNGTTFNYSTIYTGGNSVSNIFAKKGYLLIADPTDENHLAFLTVEDENGDADIYLRETFDGINWSNTIRVNDDAIGNGKMQDLVWGAFNENGVLSVCWRDRRNSNSTGYATETEIFAALKFKDSTSFEQNFPISSQQVAHDAILNSAGNDFMNIQFVADTIYAVWGDVRTGTLNIFINKTNVNTGTSSLVEIYSEKGVISIFPNPAEIEIHLKSFDLITNAELYNSKGEFIQKIEQQNTNIQQLNRGEYLIIYTYKGKKFSSKFIKN